MKINLDTPRQQLAGYFVPDEFEQITAALTRALRLAYGKAK